MLGQSVAMRAGRGTKRRPGDVSMDVSLVSKAGRAVFGDPDGSKARAAGARGRSTKPLDPIDQAWNYVEQNGTKRHTPKQRRRLEKKLRKQGLLAKTKREVTAPRVVGGYRGNRVILDEVTW